MKMPGMPHFFTKRSPRGIRRDGATAARYAATEYSSFKPDPIGQPVAEAAPRLPAIHTGQKLMPLGPISAPIATSAPQAGISSEMKASDSPNASANTIGGAHAALSRTKAMT